MTLLDSLTANDHARLRRRAVALAGDYADDLLQDAFVAALLRAGEFRRQSSVATWVYGFIGNLAMNRNTVLYGRGATKGRIMLNREYQREQFRLRSFHGTRKRAA